MLIAYDRENPNYVPFLFACLISLSSLVQLLAQRRTRITDFTFTRTGLPEWFHPVMGVGIPKTRLFTVTEDDISIFSCIIMDQTYKLTFSFSLNRIDALHELLSCIECFYRTISELIGIKDLIKIISYCHSPTSTITPTKTTAPSNKTAKKLGLSRAKLSTTGAELCFFW